MAVAASAGYEGFDVAVDDASGKIRTELWEKKLKHKMVKKKVSPMCPTKPISEDKLRCVCISDTHGITENLPKKIPPGDILIHAGDFTMDGQPWEVEDFNDFLGSLPHRRKLLIAGNHEMTFDKYFYQPDKTNLLSLFGEPKRDLDDYLRKRKLSRMHDILTSPIIIYLQDSGIEICGIHFYGSPWQPKYAGGAFNIARGKALLDKWNLIPTSTDVLITHGPPLGYGDDTGRDLRAGCVDLLSTVTHRVKPLFHLFGHIHEDHGVSTNGITTFINAAICNKNYFPCQRPIVFEVPIPPGFSKNVIQEDVKFSVSQDLCGIPPVSEHGVS